jgi:hypothetical protein
VIGVGSSLTALDLVAKSGGTDKAFIVDLSDPTQTKAAFEKALDSVRARRVPCDFPLPSPPSGEELDIDAVNVVVGGAAGDSTLAYGENCAVPGAGWPHDDRDAPKKIELCAATCDALKAAPNATIKMTFGCKTNQATPARTRGPSDRRNSGRLMRS